MTRSQASRIEVLGTVRAWQGDRELPLGAPQQRGVLALLAVAEGQPVPAQEIIDLLWQSRPPRSAVNIVQTYLKRLRRVLEPHRPARGASRMLPTVDGGYALRAEPQAVDLWRFRQLVRLARQAHRAADHRRVVTLLTEALGLWNGPPGGDLMTLSPHHRLGAVAEEHAGAVGWFAESSVITGAVAAAIPVIAQVAAARPFDEPLQANLIRLYGAAGRRSDAVRIFHTSRKRLRDELGLDPGPALAEAYRELLGSRDGEPAG